MACIIYRTLASVAGNQRLFVFGGLCPGSWLMGWPQPMRKDEERLGSTTAPLNKVHTFVRLSWFGKGLFLFLVL